MTPELLGITSLLTLYYSGLKAFSRVSSFQMKFYKEKQNVRIGSGIMWFSDTDSCEVGNVGRFHPFTGHKALRDSRIIALLYFRPLH